MNTRAFLARLAPAILLGCSGANVAALLSTGSAGIDASSLPVASSDAGGLMMDATTAPSDATLAPSTDATDTDATDADAAAEDAGRDVPPLPSLHVVGNRIYDNATPVVLTGVHRAGTEYSCVHGTGIFDGPSDAPSVQAIKTWTGANAVRVPLNEDCWLGINGVAPQYSGANYQSAIVAYTTVLLENGLYPVLDLHWSAPGAQLASAPAAMPDQDHAVAFWSQVAMTFRDNLGVVFDLFDLPSPANGQETADAWACWRDGSQAADGGGCAGIAYPVSGMQALLTAVRSAGARNLVLLGGIVSGNALSQWAAYKPDDPAANVAAAWHVFTDSPCSSTACFDAKVAPLAQVYPVVATELGESDCQGAFVETVTNWLDGQRQGYLAFTWNTWPGNCESLISDYVGTPTSPYGAAYRAHLASLADAGSE